MVINEPWKTNSDVESEFTSNDILIGTIYAVTGAIGGAAALVCMRAMRVGIHYSISPFL
jgi:hypothetical protein